MNSSLLGCDFILSSGALVVKVGVTTGGSKLIATGSGLHCESSAFTFVFVFTVHQFNNQLFSGLQFYTVASSGSFYYEKGNKACIISVLDGYSYHPYIVPEIDLWMLHKPQKVIF
jgi:hypothetical protein